MGLEPIWVNAQFISIATCQISHEWDLTCGPELCTSNIAFESERTEKQWHFSQEEITMYLGELQGVLPHIREDLPVAK